MSKLMQTIITVENRDQELFLKAAENCGVKCTLMTIEGKISKYKCEFYAGFQMYYMGAYFGASNISKSFKETIHENN